MDMKIRTPQERVVSQLDNCRTGNGAGESIAIGAGSVQSVTPFPVNTSAVRIVSTVDCWIEIGANPTAAAGTSFFLPASSPEYFAAAAGDRIAVIQASAAGFLYERPVL